MILNVTYHPLLLSLVAATPQGKSKNIARANSLHHGVVLRDGFFPDEVDSGQLVDKTILKKGWEPAALYIFGDKSLLRVGLLYHMNRSKQSTAKENIVSDQQLSFVFVKDYCRGKRSFKPCLDVQDSVKETGEECTV